MPFVFAFKYNERKPIGVDFFSWTLSDVTLDHSSLEEGGGAAFLCCFCGCKLVKKAPGTKFVTLPKNDVLSLCKGLQAF